MIAEPERFHPEFQRHFAVISDIAFGVLASISMRVEVVLVFTVVDQVFVLFGAGVDASDIIANQQVAIGRVVR